MIAFVIRRLAQSALVLLAVALLAFAMFRFVGDPVATLAGQEATSADRAELRTRLGLDDSVTIQFARFVGEVVQGNFGISYRQGRPVADLLAEKLPATLELAGVSALLALALGVVFGVFTALRRGRIVAETVMTLSLVGVSLPTFLVGIGLIWVFAVELRVLPSFGRGETVDLGAWSTGLLTRSGLASIILPALTLSLFQLTLIMRLVRSEMLDVLRADYIRFARARGLGMRAIHFGHALKNTMIPVITVTGLQIGNVVAFSIVTESVFQWPGVGALFINSVQFVDIPVMSTYLLLVAVVFVVINLVVDLLYLAVDPRLRLSRAGGHR